MVNGKITFVERLASGLIHISGELVVPTIFYPIAVGGRLNGEEQKYFYTGGVFYVSLKPGEHLLLRSNESNPPYQVYGEYMVKEVHASFVIVKVSEKDIDLDIAHFTTIN